MSVRALLALPLLLAACDPTPYDRPGDGPEVQDGVTFAELGEVSVEGYWDEVYGFAYIFVEAEAGCPTIAGFDASVDGGRFVVGSGEPRAGGREDGRCLSPRVVVERIDGPVLSLTLMDAAGDTIEVAWRDVGVMRALDFELPGSRMSAGDTVRIVGPHPGDTWESGRDVTLSWFADEGPDSFTYAFVDSEVLDGDVVFTVPDGIPAGVEVGGMVEGQLFNAVEVCEGARRCALDVGRKDGASAVAGPQ